MTRRQPKRILMISTHGYVSGRPELGRPDTGGQVVYVLRLSEALARLGYRVDIMTRRFEDQPAVEALDARVRILRFPCGGRELIRKEWLCDVIPEWVDNVERHVRSRELSYAFIDSHYWDAGLAGESLARHLGVPHVHTPHSIGSWKRDNMEGDPVELDRQYNFTRRIRDERAIYHAADAIVATTPQQRQILMGADYEVAAERTVVVPPGFDDRRFFPVSSASRLGVKRALGIDGPLILALGRIAANKGYDLLLRSMPTVLARVPDARLLLAIGSTDPTPGEIRQTDELRRLARDLGIDHHVTFHDYVSDDDLADTYRAADVFALSSRYEPFGMTAIEAMACGTPVVVTTEGGLWEMVAWGLEALYANPLDPDAFGHAITTVLQYPKVAEQLARFGAYRARSSFTWNGIAQRLVNLPLLGGAIAPESIGESGPRSTQPFATGQLGQAIEWVPPSSW
jgi:mannosylfructose-phosphate synthase